VDGYYRRQKMRAAGKIGLLVMALLVVGVVGLGQEQTNGNLAERQKAPTVLGGTGLFNTFSTRTLCKGEFNFAIFWNNFERDPGNLSINQVPFNITVGLTDRWELWADWVTWQQTTSRNPFLLSGYQLSAVRFFGDPFTILGPPVKTANAAFFPGTGAGVGGILPALGRFGTATGFTNSFNSPGGPRGPRVNGLGPAIVTDKPNYYPDLPFFGEVDFIGFDRLGQPVFGPRESSNGSGDVYIGSKFNFVNPNKHWFSISLAGYLKIPISTEEQAGARGRTNTVFEGGPILIFGQESKGHRFRAYENIGYIKVGDPNIHDVEALDLPNKVLLNGGISVALDHRGHVEFLTEVASTFWVGGRTPSVQTVSPVADWNIGLRFFFHDGAISFGGAYRRDLNRAGDVTLNVTNFAGLVPVKITPQFFVPSFNVVPELFPEHGSANGFVAYFSIGRRLACPPPPAPTCVVTPTPGTVNRGERLTIAAKPSTPGYVEGKVTYEYRWDVKGPNGQSVPVSGSGASVDVATSGIPCGSYTVTSTVTASVPAVDCPSNCVTTGQTTCTATFVITEPPCPTVSCDVSATPSQVRQGERVTLRATGRGEGSLSYSWSTTGGTLSSTTGSEVTLDTTGASGTITVSVNVATDKTSCGNACPGSSCSTTVTIATAERPPILPVVPCGPIFFPFNSARINNEHKACLDEIALRLQQDPRSALVIDGHRDSTERVGISLTRANNARDYLVNEKGVDAARITVRNFGDTCPHESGDPALNRRVEFWILPEGATIAGVDGMKKCASGATPQVITTEEPAKGVERPVRRRSRRRRHPEPEIGMVQPG
jgi:flagellar motor protein MotB